jgi:uncharacterized membrane protein YfcA
MTFELIVLALVMLGASFCSAVAGFAMNLIAAGVLLHIMTPQELAPLLPACSLCVQAVTLRAVWHAIDWPRLWRYVVPGVIGTPVGVWLLGAGSVRGLVIFIGVLLVLYSGYMLTRLMLRRPPPEVRANRGIDVAVGFGSGVLGGIGGFSGPLMALWVDIQGLNKNQARALLQPFIAGLQVMATGTLLVKGYFTTQTWTMLAVAVPALVVGSWLGLKAYHAMPPQLFRISLLTLLMVSGLSLLW